MILPSKCPPLIAKNIGESDEFAHKITLERVASAVIDGNWHYSWHWDRHEKYGTMTTKGWQKALADGRRLLLSLEAHARQIRDVLPLIESEIETQKQWESDE